MNFVDFQYSLVANSVINIYCLSIFTPWRPNKSIIITRIKSYSIVKTCWNTNWPINRICSWRNNTYCCFNKTIVIISYNNLNISNTKSANILSCLHHFPNNNLKFLYHQQLLYQHYILFGSQSIACNVNTFKCKI